MRAAADPPQCAPPTLPCCDTTPCSTNQLTRTAYYAQLVLCFLAEYADRVQGESVHELCYVRWLDTDRGVAAIATPDGTNPRPLTEAEQRGPFKLFRWAMQPPGCGQGHPAARGPYYGIVRANDVMHRVQLLPSVYDLELFRLNTDVRDL